jgi:hypothetical protein
VALVGLALFGIGSGRDGLSKHSIVARSDNLAGRIEADADWERRNR